MQNLAEVQDLGQRVDDRLRVLKERFDERLHAPPGQGHWSQLDPIFFAGETGEIL